MNNETPFENNLNQDKPAGAIGARLKRAREQLDLTIVDIANQLRLKPERIASLEKDDYQNMPSATFVKGYLRAYSRLVNLPADEIIALFDQLKPIPEARMAPLVSKLHPSSLQDKPVRWGLYLTGLTIVILVAIWWNSVPTNDVTLTPNTGMPPQPLKNEPAANTSVPNTMQPTNTLQPTTVPVPQASPPTTNSAHVAGGPPMSTPAAPTDTKSAATPADSSNDSAANNSANSAANDDDNSGAIKKKSSKKSRHRDAIDAQDENFSGDNEDHPMSRYNSFE